MRELAMLVLAALLEVGGDAVIRRGIRGGGVGLVAAGIAVLAAYGIMVNLTHLDFGRLMGLYIILFFAIAQAVAVVVFKEPLKLPVLVGGSLVLAGGLLMTVWRAA